MIKTKSLQSRVAAFGLLVLLILSPITSIAAQGPGLGHAFYGTVQVDGQDAQAGSVIVARVDGIEHGSYTLVTDGLYFLLVQGEIAEGATIRFYVGGQSANQTFGYHDGWTTELNLTAPAPSNGEEPEPDPDPDPEPEPDPDPSPDPDPDPYPYPYPFPFPFPLPSGFPFECFIATAAYGTPTAGQIDVLREFRDVVLMRSAAGSVLVAAYYHLSPPVAEAIASNGFYRAVVRELVIDPVVWVVRATGDLWRK
jgi:hypothetical protein